MSYVLNSYLLTYLYPRITGDISNGFQIKSKSAERLNWNTWQRMVACTTLTQLHFNYRKQ